MIEVKVYCPMLKEVPEKLWDLLACIPLMNFNQDLMQSLKNHPKKKIYDFVIPFFTHDVLHIQNNFLKELKESGVKKIVNFPGIDAVDGYARESMDSLGFNLESEVKLMEKARDDFGLKGIPCIYTLNSLKFFMRRGFDSFILVFTQSNSTPGISATESNFQKIKEISENSDLKIYFRFTGGSKEEPKNLFFPKAKFITRV